MIVRIDAFTDPSGNNVIPIKYTCNGEEVSPGVQWSDVPEKTKSFVLITGTLLFMQVHHEANNRIGSTH